MTNMMAERLFEVISKQIEERVNGPLGQNGKEVDQCILERHNADGKECKDKSKAGQ